ncbi:Ubiquitin-specific protease incomplete domain containing protein [Pandoravirus neocaledonia]|uniref:Ubiquitin-specific protease incomplete domain containing protein n=1 Tax=Pandoravirus neocaledonia TaxID=2107708 RepID=A0A2U7UC59_9VIRU|nr:Ubiquitin-specific protease incomplete domain containing protein [Pandoravirus neocaledonia]AVK75910.1 Ubiquitin-specific protease incomplete domain containing protein [Pandoravirus neocaledonia]
MPKQPRSRRWRRRVASRSWKWSTERHARATARAKKRSVKSAHSPSAADDGAVIAPTLHDGSPVGSATIETARPVSPVPFVVALDARGVRITTTYTTLSNAPLGTLLHRIAASAHRRAVSGSGCDIDAPLSLVRAAQGTTPFDPCACQEDGSYFVDVRSEWLAVILDFLVHGVVTAPKFGPSVVLGVQAAADYLGVAALSLACAANWARHETMDASSDERITVTVVTPRDISRHARTVDVFSPQVGVGPAALLSFSLLSHHRLDVVAHIVYGALEADPGALAFYGCIARRDTAPRPVARIDPEGSPIALGDSWATRGMALWLFVTRRKPSDVLPPVVSCGPTLEQPRNVPLLLFVKVFDLKKKRLDAPRHVVIADPNAAVASALPALIEAAGICDEGVDINTAAIYKERKTRHVCAVDLQRSFAHGEIENGDILWLCVDPADAAELGKRTSMSRYTWIRCLPSRTW